MLHLKLFESYYDDLTPYTYGRSLHNNIVNIGWLDSQFEYTKGEVDPLVIDKLKSLEPSHRYKGTHRCPFCGLDRTSVNFTIEGNGKYYCFPGLLVHYIEKHNYLPPSEFIESVMNIKKIDKPLPKRHIYPHNIRRK